VSDDGFEHIVSYTRAQAIEDGVLVDVTELHPDEIDGKPVPMARQAGLLYPVALTREAWETVVALSPAAEKAGNDEKGRLWDVLWMLTAHVRTHGQAGTQVSYDLLVVRKKIEPTMTRLKAVFGPGDDGKPVVTIMMPGED